MFKVVVLPSTVLTMLVTIITCIDSKSLIFSITVLVSFRVPNIKKSGKLRCPNPNVYIFKLVRKVLEKLKLLRNRNRICYIPPLCKQGFTKHQKTHKTATKFKPHVFAQIFVHKAMEEDRK